MNQRDGTGIGRILQIGIKLPQLTHQKHALVHHGTGGHGNYVCIVVALFKYPSDDVQLPVKIQAPAHALRSPEKSLPDVRHAISGPLSQHIFLHRHLPPADKLHAFFLGDDLHHLHGLAPFQLVLREKEHAHAVIPRSAQVESQLPAFPAEKFMRDLEQNPHAVSRLSLSVFSCPVFQLFHDIQRLFHHTVVLTAVNADDGADPAGIVLPVRIVYFKIAFLHCLSPFRPTPGKAPPCFRILTIIFSYFSTAARKSQHFIVYTQQLYCIHFHNSWLYFTKSILPAIFLPPVLLLPAIFLPRLAVG